MALTPRGLVDARLRAGFLDMLLALPLTSLTPWLKDTDVCIELGQQGVHGKLVRNLNAPTCSADDLDGLASAVESCTRALPPGIVFPMSPKGLAAQPPPPPTALELGRFLPASNCDSCLPVILARMIPASLQSLRGQEDVGQLLWPAGPVLSRWVAAHPWIFRGNRVLEIGSGMGLCGLAAGLVGAVAETDGSPAGVVVPSTKPPTTRSANACVVMSDFNARVLHNLSYNARLNEPALNASHPSMECWPMAASGSERVFDVKRLDWASYVPARQLAMHAARYKSARLAAAAYHSDSSPAPQGSGAVCSGFSSALRPDVPELQEPSTDSDGEVERATLRGALSDHHPDLALDETFDVILGSDMVCCVEDAWCVAAAIARHLRRPHPAAAAAASASGLDRDGPEKRGLSLCTEAGCCAAGARSSGSRAPTPEGSEGGVAFLLLPPPAVRWGVEAVEEALRDAGLRFEERALPPRFAEGDAAAGSLGWYRPPVAAADDSPASGLQAAAEQHLPELVVAGGYERVLRLFTITWPPVSARQG